MKKTACLIVPILLFIVGCKPFEYFSFDNKIIKSKTGVITDIIIDRYCFDVIDTIDNYGVISNHNRRDSLQNDKWDVFFDNNDYLDEKMEEMWDSLQLKDYYKKRLRHLNDSLTKVYKTKRYKVFELLEDSNIVFRKFNIDGFNSSDRFSEEEFYAKDILKPDYFYRISIRTKRFQYKYNMEWFIEFIIEPDRRILYSKEVLKKVRNQQHKNRIKNL